MIRSRSNFVIDFHTHVFPDHIAAKALEELQVRCGGLRLYSDATLNGLAASMEKAGISHSVIAHVATKPEHAQAILRWSREIRRNYPQMISFPSFLPTQPDALSIIAKIHKEGYSGVKLHPYYQDFELNSPQVQPVFAELERRQLIVLLHTGYDIAFPRDERCTPEPLIQLLRRYPRLKLVAAHFGSWGCWKEVLQRSDELTCYVDLAVVRPFVTPSFFRQMLLSFPQDRILFGSDSPWSCQKQEVQAIRDLHLPEAIENAILYDNAARLLQLS